MALWGNAPTKHSLSDIGMECGPFERAMTPNNDKRAVILVVEDVEETRHATRLLLTASGYQVNTAEDEETAVFEATYVVPT